jgi:small subunit ribosomal protein S21|tara:strand:+ start:206 stop:403 length:198 start_codon:yes stop_codon:yes gene_type:complete
MLIIKVGKNEKIDRALKRYKKKFKKTGLIKQLRELEYYEKPSTKRRKIIDKAKYIQKQKEKDGDI